MEKINAPFSQSQIDNLNYYQQHGSLHPFSCGGGVAVPICERASGKGDGVLIPTVEGWVCPCGQYRQDWAWDFMMLPPDEQDSILKQRAPY